ncbi:phosphodiesterase, partial [Micromonospora sp. D75]|nr:phosphodiesterase [Micromonospora sp. D75]
CLHHPPVAVGVPGMDAMGLADADALAAVVGRHPHVVRVAAGHLHRQVTSAFAGTVLTVAPSTWIQVSLSMSDEEEPGFVAEPTAFLLHLVADGGCVTHTVQVSHAAGRTCWF